MLDILHQDHINIAKLLNVLRDILAAIRSENPVRFNLLRDVLTVEAGKAHSHAKTGWEQFTDRVIAALNEHREGIVFLLWGSHAQKKGQYIDRNKHHVLMAPHPSPLSAHRGFLGCGHFSRTNQLLQEAGKQPVNWQIPPII